MVFFVYLLFIMGVVTGAAFAEDAVELAVDEIAATTDVTTAAELATDIETSATLPVEEPEDQPPRYIMGKGETWAELLVSFLLNYNTDADCKFVERLAVYYIAEAKTEGVNHDIAFAQMCLETGFLRFDGLVVPEMNNFSGLGAIGPGEQGLWFSSVEIGVRAHIQHLKAYASVDPLEGELVNPRYRFVRRGSSPAIQGLAGTWAADPLYAEKIEGILQRLYVFRDQYLESKTLH